MSLNLVEKTLKKGYFESPIFAGMDNNHLLVLGMELVKASLPRS
jgi:hypothetical protein